MRSSIFLLAAGFAAVACTACGSDGDAGSSGGASADAVPLDTAPLDTAPLDTRGPDAAADTADTGPDGAESAADTAPDAGDTAPDTPGTDCPGGPSCPCSGNGDCDNATCLATHEGKRCAVPCVDTCPAGYACAKLGESDSSFYCVSKSLTLCAPCATDADCRPRGGGALCLGYGDDGRFCGAVCEQAGDCPDGYSCVQGEGASGESAKQCRLDSGVCECSQWAIEQSASTICRVRNEHGSCAAVRKCLAAGLQPCAARTPAVEVCNALDDDCDGIKDELPADASCEKRAFEQKGSAAGCADDGDCTVPGEACDKGQCRVLIGACKGVPICAANGTLICQDARVPELESCDGKDNDCDGLTDEGFAIALAGGVTAAVGAACGLGECAGGRVRCANFFTALCSTASKAADADTCDGKDNDCDGLTDEGACDDGDACTRDTCRPATGTCEHAPALDCDDGEPCTDDACVKATGACTHTPREAGCDDGDACTVGDVCAGGRCAPGKAKTCDDGNPCTDDGCDKDKGCVAPSNAATCTDGDACTAGDLCKGGECVPGPAPDCDDGNPCTDDGCDKDKGCVALPNGATCSDGDACTTGDRCAGVLCKPGAKADCDDSRQCTNDACDPGLGCTHTARAGSCTDGDVCTVGDTCSADTCVSGKPQVCDDGNVCTRDGCSPAIGCVHTWMPLATACDDGDACTDKDGCKDGECAPGSPPDCDDGRVCTVDGCHPKAGCIHLPSQGTCTDGDACTAPDTCHGGGCVPGPARKCDDGNACTTDACDRKKGCTNRPLAGVGCDDGNACTEKDTCSGGACRAGHGRSCDDGDACTADRCEPASGCVFDKGKGCDDGDPCTTDGCDPGTGCSHKGDLAATGCSLWITDVKGKLSCGFSAVAPTIDDKGTLWAIGVHGSCGGDSVNNDRLVGIDGGSGKVVAVHTIASVNSQPIWRAGTITLSTDWNHNALCGGCQVSYSAATGAVLWKGGQGPHARGGISMAANGTIYSSHGNVLAIGPSGKSLWSAGARTSQGRGTWIGGDGTVLSCAMGGTCRGFAPTGKIRWSLSTTAGGASIASDGAGRWYVVTAGALTVYGSDGVAKGSFASPDGDLGGVLLAGDGRVLLGSTRGRVRLVDGGMKLVAARDTCGGKPVRLWLIDSTRTAWLTCGDGRVATLPLDGGQPTHFELSGGARWIALSADGHPVIGDAAAGARRLARGGLSYLGSDWPTVNADARRTRRAAK